MKRDGLLWTVGRIGIFVLCAYVVIAGVVNIGQIVTGAPDYGMFKDCEVYEDGTAVCHMADSDPGRGVK